MSFISSLEDSLVLKVYVQPGAKASEVQGLFDGRLKLRLAAPPVEGKANKELLKFLSKISGVAKSDMKIIRGELSRKKDVKVKGLSEKALGDILSNYL